MKKVKKMIVLGMVVLSLMSALTFSVFSAGNVSDTIINISARSNNGGTPCRSIWREKKDYTSVWCENKSTSGGSLSAWVQRTNNKNTSSVKTVDRYYGSWSEYPSRNRQEQDEKCRAVSRGVRQYAPCVGDPGAY